MALNPDTEEIRKFMVRGMALLAAAMTAPVDDEPEQQIQNVTALAEDYERWIYDL